MAPLKAEENQRTGSSNGSNPFQPGGRGTWNQVLILFSANARRIRRGFTNNR
jgi:hypothetical protein